MSDKYIFVLLVSKIFSLCSKSRPHRPALHRTLVTLNNTFYQLIPSKKYIALHISFFSWRYVVSMLNVKRTLVDIIDDGYPSKQKLRNLCQEATKIHIGATNIFQKAITVLNFGNIVFHHFDMQQQVYNTAMAERTKLRNIWFLSPLFHSKREETKTKYSAPKAPLFSKTVFTGHGSGSNPVAAKIRYLLLFKNFIVD